MALSKKHYEAIAKAIKAQRGADTMHCNPAEYGELILDRLAEDLGAYMERDNPAFQYARFVKACGVQS